MIRDSDKESGKDIKWAKAKNGTVGSINTIVDAEIAKLPRRYRLEPAESTPPLLFNQIYELAPMYALFIVESIPGLEECASLSLNYSTASWTINEPESLIADTNDFKNITNWKQFLAKLKSNWYTKLEQTCLVEADTRSVITQMLRLCDYLVNSRIPMPLETWNIIHFLVSLCLLNYQRINDEQPFSKNLQELQFLIENVNISVPAPLSLNHPVSARMQMIMAFVHLPMSEHRVKLSRLAFGSYSNYTPLFKLSREVELCCNYLCLVENETDTTKCSRWFREQGSMEERKKLIDMGITRYLQTTKVVNSVTIANYIKSLLREIPGGLISSNMQELLTDLLRKQDGRLYLLDIDGLEIEAARAILAQIPFGIMSNLLKLCSFIFEKGKVDPLSPQALARIVTVTSEDRLHKIDPKDQKEIQKLLNDWHSVWGYIISHENLFI